MKIITLKVSEDLLRQVDEAARLLGWSRSELVRVAVAKYIKEHVPEVLQRRRHASIQYRVVRVW